MTVVSGACPQCEATVEGPDLDAFSDAFLAHARDEHPDELPFPDVAIRNYAAATQRATGPTERLEALPGAVEVRRVTEADLDDWATFFDRDAFPDNLPWAACYCSEPIRLAEPQEGEGHTWEENRDDMRRWLADGRAVGYLAYVDGRPAGWVNASAKSEVRYRAGTEADDGVISVSCFVIAPPYRGHGLARRLLDAVVAEAPARGATAVEGYPRPQAQGAGANYHGPLALYLAAGFEVVAEGDQYTTVRKPVSG